MKPVKEDKLLAVLDRAAEKLAKNEKILQFQTANGLVRVPVYQIRYADVSGNYVTIHAATDITVKMTLGELEKELDDRFHRVGRSAIVNLTQISRVTKSDIFLNGGTAVPLPRGRAASTGCRPRGMPNRISPRSHTGDNAIPQAAKPKLAACGISVLCCQD